MKKMNLSRLLALVMMLALVAGSFAGCGGKNAKKSDEELIVGKWETNLDFGEMMNASMGESGAAMFGDMDLSGITMKMSIEFKKDGAYAVEVDKDSAEVAMAQLVDKMVPALKELFKGMLADAAEIEVADVTEEMLNEVLKEMNVDSWEAFAEGIKKEMKPGEMVEQMKMGGKWLIKDGKLHMTTDADGDPAKEEGQTYKLSEKSLSLTLPGEEMADIKELTFNRLG